jgi:hypothetical protein
MSVRVLTRLTVAQHAHCYFHVQGTREVVGRDGDEIKEADVFWAQVEVEVGRCSVRAR